MNKLKELGFILADAISNFIGSWTFIIIQSIVVLGWVLFNVSQFNHFDPYPFILLNLFFSTEAAYATPLILMAGKRQSEKDAAKVDRDLLLDNETNTLLKQLAEDLKLDRQAIKDHIQMKKDIEHIKKELDKIIQK
jgi:uncharacterized membrane protein